jgi:hypothetical protein
MTSTSNEPPIMFPALNYEKNYTKPPTSISPSQEAEQDHKEGDKKPGAVSVPGMGSRNSPGVQEDDLDEMNEAIPTGTTADRGATVAPDVEYGEIQQPLAEDQDLADAVAKVAEPPIYKNRRFRVYMAVGCCILLMAIVMAIVGTTAFGDNGDIIRETNEPTSTPTMSPTTSEPTSAPTISSQTLSAFYIPDTSSGLARQWIINEDPLQLDVNSTHVLQRYLMAFFYYSTSNNGYAPWKSCGPAVEGEDDSCVLLEFTKQDDDSIAYVEQPGKTRWLSGTHECEWEGILCTGGNDVRGIQIGE